MVKCSTAVFSSRPRGYRIAVVLLFLTTVGFLVGNLTPQWMHYSKTERNVPFGKSGTIRYRYTEAHSSALYGCSTLNETIEIVSPSGFQFSTKQASSCGSGYSDDSTSGPWVKAAQAFEVMGILALLFACIYTVWVNFLRTELRPRRPFAEIATIAAGTLGFIGTMIFISKLASEVRDSDLYSFAWSLYFTIFISIVVIVVGVIIAIFNREASGDYTEIKC